MRERESTGGCHGVDVFILLRITAHLWVLPGILRDLGVVKFIKIKGMLSRISAMYDRSFPILRDGVPIVPFASIRRA